MTINTVEVIGHLENREKLKNLIRRDMLAHSNLLIGPRGIGKRLVAKELSQVLLCENNSGIDDCDSCRLFCSGNHPDFYQLECESEVFNAESARDLLHSINLAPYRGQKRVIILNDADNISTVVANLLLKTLEEPRKDTVFFLIASNASRLPLPIVSRCQLWRFAKLTEDEIREAMIQIENQAMVDDLVELADGSLENIKDIENFIPLWEKTKLKLSKIMSGDSYLALSYATELAKDKEHISSNLRLIRLFISSELRKEENINKQLILADGLDNIIAAESLITERNLAPLNLLNLCLLALSGKLPPQGRLISDIVV